MKRQVTISNRLGYCTINLYVPFGVQFELMQFTGLKDKNGKGIYEGDLVKRPSATEPMNEEVWQVVWNQTQLFGFALQQGVYYCGIMEPDDKLEIIGNIYENPELLSDPKH